MVFGFCSFWIVPRGFLAFGFCLVGSSGMALEFELPSNRQLGALRKWQQDN